MMANNTPMAPWTGRLLWVDLTSGEVAVRDSEPYLVDYLGGRGLAARLAWDLLPPGVGALDAENVLFFMVGALVGTPAPSAGRVTICGLSPQAYPHEWYTRANLGGHWGAALKYAGYDGLIVTGRAAQPVVLVIDDDRVALQDAGDLWGQGLIVAQQRLGASLGPDWRVLAIGPAGENLCRYAIIATGTESAAGQGGFGAVMGSKQLKAIAVRGTGGVRVSQALGPAEMLRRARLVARRAQERYDGGSTGRALQDAGFGEPRPAPCTFSCPRSCGYFYREVPGVVHPERTYSGQVFCCAPRMRGGAWLGAEIPPQAAFELAQISNDLGLNHWELTFGLVPWLLRMREAGALSNLDGDPLAFDDPAYWAEFMTRIATRQGWGDLLAEGGPRVADHLGVGHDVISEMYPAWGHASHWDGHGTFPSPHFPFWLVTALQWAMDTRDPIGGGHGYTTNIFGLVRALNPAPEDAAVWDKLAHVGRTLYGSPSSVDPRVAPDASGYEGKAYPGVVHGDTGALKDSLGLCDNIFPLLTDPKAENLFIEIDDGHAVIEGRHLEHYLFEAASDATLDREAFYRTGARILTLERLLAIRNWSRDRATDETILAYLRHPEGSVNPYLGAPEPFDEPRFRALLDEYYTLRGWDSATARPLPDTLRALGLSELAGGSEDA